MVLDFSLSSSNNINVSKPGYFITSETVSFSLTTFPPFTKVGALTSSILKTQSTFPLQSGVLHFKEISTSSPIDFDLSLRKKYSISK
jgi:hypothetical protein